MTSRFDGINGMSLRAEAIKGVPPAEKPDFRAALVSRLDVLSSAGPEGNAEVLAIKDAIDAAFPGEDYYLTLRFS